MEQHRAAGYHFSVHLCRSGDEAAEAKFGALVMLLRSSREPGPGVLLSKTVALRLYDMDAVGICMVSCSSYCSKTAVACVRSCGFFERGTGTHAAHFFFFFSSMCVLSSCFLGVCCLLCARSHIQCACGIVFSIS